jgi:hypothetical protein
MNHLLKSLKNKEAIGRSAYGLFSNRVEMLELAKRQTQERWRAPPPKGIQVFLQPNHGQVVTQLTVRVKGGAIAVLSSQF